MKAWGIEETGYTPLTTFWEDFSIAEMYINVEEDPVGDTFRRAFEEWKTDYIYLTELVLVLDWKVWEHYKTNAKLADEYLDLLDEARDYAFEHLEGHQLRYYLETTD